MLCLLFSDFGPAKSTQLMPSQCTGSEVITSSAEIFDMIGGGRVDVSIQGAIEVSAKGDLANWSHALHLPPGYIHMQGIGATMDLAANCKKVQCLSEHCIYLTLQFGMHIH